MLIWLFFSLWPNHVLYPESSWNWIIFDGWHEHYLLVCTSHEFVLAFFSSSSYLGYLLTQLLYSWSLNSGGVRGTNTAPFHAVKYPYTTLQSALHTWGSAFGDLTNQGSYSIGHIYWKTKYSRISAPWQFKPLLFKDQLYITIRDWSTDLFLFLSDCCFYNMLTLWQDYLCRDSLKSYTWDYQQYLYLGTRKIEN